MSFNTGFSDTSPFTAELIGITLLLSVNSPSSYLNPQPAEQSILLTYHYHPLPTFARPTLLPLFSLHRQALYELIVSDYSSLLLHIHNNIRGSLHLPNMTCTSKELDILSTIVRYHHFSIINKVAGGMMARGSHAQSSQRRELSNQTL